MANYYRRLAVLCILLLSSASVVSGKIRGNYYDASLEAATSDGRKLMRMKGGMKSLKKGEHYKEKEKGVKGVKGASDDDHTESPTEVDTHTVMPEHTMQPSPPHKGTKSKEAGGDYYKGGYKGGHEKGGDKGGYEKGGSKSLKHKGAKSGVKGSYGKGSKSKGGDKSAKEKSKGGSKKGSMSKYHEYHGKAVEKKSHTVYSEKSKAYNKSKDKLQKSASKKSSGDYHTEEPTEHPVLEPTLVEVPMSFFFKFEETAERRRLDGHIYEPGPEEIETLKSAVMEYAVGLFNYLHESKPDTFYSVTPVIDAVIFDPEAEYPLQVDVTFNVLYNEAPEDAPGPDEVATVLISAFTTQEFVWYYLWGHDSIWDSVSSVHVEYKGGGSGGPAPDGSAVHVMATMVYAFGVNPTTEPTDADYDILVSVTEKFFTDLLTDLYKDNSETTFEALTIEQQATTFDLTSTPPVLIDFAFHVTFDENSAVIPSSDFLFTVMAQTLYDDYIRLYLEPSESIWSTVNRVALLEFMPPQGMETAVVGTPQAAYLLRGTMVHSFFSGMAVRPGKEDYDKLEMATNFFFSETLTNAYNNNTDTSFLSATTQISSTLYDDTATEPLQVNYDTSVLFEGIAPEYEEVFKILQDADYESYIMSYLWDEGEPWTSINGVMYVEQIPAEGRL